MSFLNNVSNFGGNPPTSANQIHGGKRRGRKSVKKSKKGGKGTRGKKSRKSRK